MCGRFAVEAEGLDEAYRAFTGAPWPGAPNRNTAPTETAWIIRAERRAASDAGEPWTAAEAKWWLTPFWSQSPKPKFSAFNARAETLATSRTFREPFKRRRCVVPVSGFYEWRRRVQPSLLGGPSNAARASPRPYFVRPRAGALLLGGVWDRWRRGDEAFDSFAIVTTPVSDGLAFLHDRQPLMLSRGDARRWLAGDASADGLAALLAPRLPVALSAVPVAGYVGDPRNKGPQCVAPIGDAMPIEADD